MRPTRVHDLKILESDPDWKPEWQRALDQFHLFGHQPKPLAKISFKFSYVFECEDSSRPHNAMIEDWELGVLYLKELERLEDEQRAAESVKHKFLDELCCFVQGHSVLYGNGVSVQHMDCVRGFLAPQNSSHSSSKGLTNGAF